MIIEASLTIIKNLLLLHSPLVIKNFCYNVLKKIEMVLDRYIKSIYICIPI